MKNYKLRAECLSDVLAFIQGSNGWIQDYAIKTIDGGPDVVVEFAAELPMSDLLSIFDLIPDSHVMAETLKPSNYYTGDRTYQE